MKKLLSVIFLFSLIVSFVSVTSSINAMQIPEGAIIKTEHNPDVYIVKYKNGKQFKRLVLNPQVFESYGHLRWEDILIVSQSKMNSFTESTLVRSDGESNVYKLVANGDLGNKALVETGYTYDLDSVYTINNIDSGNYVLKKLEELAGIIDELQKQIDDIKTEISTPKVDFCNNIEGDQTYIPDGMYRNNGNCFAEIVVPEPEPTPQIDFCNNIEGLQTCTPDGMYRDNGNCFTKVVIPEIEPAPIQEIIPVFFESKTKIQPWTSPISTVRYKIQNTSDKIITISGMEFKLNMSGGIVLGSKSELHITGELRYLEAKKIIDIIENDTINIPLDKNINILPYDTEFFEISIYYLTGSILPSAQMTIELNSLTSPTENIIFNGLPIISNLDRILR